MADSTSPWLKGFFRKYLIDAFTGMALGLFVTLIAGLIISQVGSWLALPALMSIGKLASILMGAGIGVGIAYYLKAPPLVVMSCLVAGMLGAHSGSKQAHYLRHKRAHPPHFWHYRATPLVHICPQYLPIEPAAGWQVKPA